MADAVTTVETKVEGQTAEVAETTPAPEAETKPEEKAPEVDLAAELTKERARADKAESDLKAVKKGRLVAEERDEALSATRALAEEARDETRATRAALKALITARDDPEALAQAAAALDKHEQEVTTRRGKQTQEQKEAVALTKIRGIGTAIGVDVDTDTNFAEAARLYNLGRFDEAVVEVYETRDRILAERAEQAKAKEAEAPKPKAEPKRTMTDIGRGSGGQGPRVTNENIDSLWLKFDREHPNEPNPYTSQYREVLKR